jgi:hydrogenase maturation protein HypF
LPLIGGDRAAREPWRMGLAALSQLGRMDAAGRILAQAPQAVALLANLRGRHWPQTSSLGRLFDAAGSLLGVCHHQDFEGQAAMRLEALVEQPQALPGGYALRDGMLDFSNLLAHLVDVADARRGAEILHGTLIEGIAGWIAAYAQPGEKIALGGGCLMNRVLAEGLTRALRQKGFAPLLAQAAPPNDGGLSLGQAALARLLLRQTPALLS